MIVVKVRDRDIKAAPMGPVTTGSVGLPVRWHFSEEWDDLAKTAVFRVGNDGTEITVAVLEDLCLVPDELLVQANADENLWIGVYGWKGTNANDTIVPEIAMPTIWTYTRIQDGSQPSGIEPPEGTPGWSAQIQNATDEALRVAHGVAADAAEGDFDGISPAVTISSITHGHSVTITDREHPTGQSFNVMDGDSAYEQAVAGGYEGTEAQFNEELASFKELSEQAADSAAAAAQSESNADASAQDSEAYAIGKRNGVDVGAGDPASNNNSKYYMELAAHCMLEASSSEATATSSMRSARNYASSAQNYAGQATSSASDAATAKGAAETAQEAAEEAAEDAEAYAVGKRGGTDVGSSDPAYHNNAKYYAQQASGSASDAATAKGAAEDAQEAAEAVLASIPSDYTELTEDVDDLKSALNWCVTPEMFGAKGDGVTDDSTAINNAITYAQNNGFPVLMARRGAVYGVASPIVLNAGKTQVTLDFNDASIKAIAAVEEIIKINAASFVWNQMRNLYIDCAGLAEYGIYCTYVSTFHFEHIKIVDFTNTALYIKQGNCVVHDMYINWTLGTLGASPIGIQNDGTDSKFHNVTMRNCKVGVYNKGGLTFYQNIHPWIANGDILQNSIGFWINAGTSLTSCYADTYETAIRIDGQQAVSLTDFQVFINGTFYTPEAMGAVVPRVFDLMSTAQNKSKYPAAAMALSICGMRLNMSLPAGFADVAHFSNIAPNEFLFAMRTPEGLASIECNAAKVSGVPKKLQSLFFINPSAYPRDIASGSIASFSDGADGLPVKDLTVSIEPVQSGNGDPSPENVRPITGWSSVNINSSGVNLWDEEWELGAINSSTGLDSDSSTQLRTKNYIPVKPGMSVFVVSPNQGTTSTGNLQGRYYDKNKQYLGSDPAMKVGQVVTIPDNCFYVRFAMQYTYGTTYNHDISINYPSSDHEYHAYQGGTYFIAFPAAAGTVYGGTLDVTTGILTVDRVGKQYAVGDGNISRATTAVSGKIRFYLDNFVTGIAKPATSAAVTTAICSVFKSGSYNNTFNANIDNCFSVGENGDIYFFVDSLSTLTGSEASAAFRALLDETLPFFVFPLETPITYQLTPQEVTTLLGANNLWADCGDSTVEYRADTTLYINKKISEANT